MIQKTDMRIGNAVLFDQKPDKIFCLYEGWASGYSHSHWHYERINPIALTPEILEKCGFEFYILQRRECFRKGKFYLHKTVYMGYRYGMNTHIKYLHQLQNLYFVITGKELPITL